MVGRSSLRERYPRRLDLPLLLSCATVVLPLGLLLPTVTVSRVAGASRATFSVVTGILDLASNGEIFLALVILCFSVIFPIVKLIALWILWFRRMDPELREGTLRNLKTLGKWSMLDVFVVAIFVGAIQFGLLASARPRFGIYLFSLAVLLSMVTTFMEYRLARMGNEGVPGVPAPSLAALPVALLSILFLGAGVSLPLMEVKKWVFWSREYSVLSGTRAMIQAGNYLMAGVMTLLVIVIPLGTLGGQAALILVRKSHRHAAKLTSLLGFLDKWTMVDVFALGLVVVLAKLGAFAVVAPRLGLACLLAGVFLLMATSWLIRG